MNMAHPNSFLKFSSNKTASNFLLVGIETVIYNPLIFYSHEKKYPTCNMAMLFKHPNVFSKQHPSATINR
jgi:hypothetical protein